MEVSKAQLREVTGELRSHSRPSTQGLRPSPSSWPWDQVRLQVRTEGRGRDSPFLSCSSADAVCFSPPTAVALTLARGPDLVCGSLCLAQCSEWPEAGPPALGATASGAAPSFREEEPSPASCGSG